MLEGDEQGRTRLWTGAHLSLMYKDHGFSASIGRASEDWAAGTFYMACQETMLSITQKDIAKAAGVTEVTVRNRYSGLQEALKNAPSMASQKNLQL